LLLHKLVVCSIRTWFSLDFIDEFMAFSAIKNMPRLLPVLVVALALIGAAFYLNSRSERDPVESSASIEIPVRVAQVKRATLPLTVRLTGELLPLTKTDVVSRLAGKVTEMRFKVGDFVTAGTIVTTIGASDLDQRLGALEASVRAAKQDLREREAELADAEKRLAESRELLRRDLIARRDVEQSERTAETVRAQAELTRAYLAQREAMLAQVRALQDLTRLAAPISGEIGSVRVARGAAVGDGSTILSIVSLDTLKLVAQVSGASLLRRGMKAQISTAGLPGIISKGQVVRFQPEKDSKGKNEAEIHVDNGKKILRPGMTVEASINLEAEEKVILIPRSAVVSENKSNYVYKLSEGRAIRHPVVIGALSGDEIAIAQGLNAGDAVIVDLQRVKPGTRVRLVSAQTNPVGNAR
jgi:RND family efflux transporter MFP subunit